MEYNWQNYTVLVTEDDEISFRYIELVLSRKTNINIIWAINGKQAVEYCEIYDYIDVVLMDLNLPEMDGYEATKAIRKWEKELKAQSSKLKETGSDELSAFNFQLSTKVL